MTTLTGTEVASRTQRDEAAVRRAFVRNPTLPWTPDGIAMWFGVPLATVDRVIGEMMVQGLVRPGGRGTFRLVGRSGGRSVGRIAS